MNTNTAADVGLTGTTTSLCLALEGWSREHAGHRLAITIQGGSDGARVRLAVDRTDPDAVPATEASVFRHLLACERLRDTMGQIDHLRAFADQPRAAAALAEAIVDAEVLARRVDPAGMLLATAPRSPLATPPPSGVTEA